MNNMSVMTRFKNQYSRIIVCKPNGVTQTYTRKSNKEVIYLFDGLILNEGETAVYEEEVNGKWVIKETKKHVGFK
jgi:hypothetical protein